LWQLDDTFPLIGDLRKILNYDVVDRRTSLAKRFQRCGKIQAIILSGFFLNDQTARVDLVVVGDSLNKREIEKIIHKIEAEVGKELVYAILETADFNFRLFSGDKFLRDIFDYPYEYAVNKLALSS
jgi:hypothetical protein